MGETKQRLGLIFGGRSAEHDVSIRSASQALAALDHERFDPMLFAIDRQGAWKTADAATDAGAPSVAELAAIVDTGKPVTELALELQRCDAVFPLVHGPYGEDGRLQGLLESMDVPYVGSGVLASALAMDKGRFKSWLASPDVDLPHVPGIVIDADDASVGPHSPTVAALGYPLFVKPSNLGSSVGIRRVDVAEDLKPAIAEAARYDDRVIIERGVDARELEVAVLGAGGPDAHAFGPGEIVLPEGTWYDYDTKYESDVAEVRVPADIDAGTAQRARELALRAFRSLGCHGLARVDLFLDRQTGELTLNEINTLPGFTSISMYPKLAQAAGIGFPALITQLVELALARAGQRSALE